MNNEMITYGSEREYAGFWILAGESFIDGIIIIIITMPLMYMAYGDDYLYSEDIVLGLSDVVLNYVFPLCATIGFWVYKSATLGKMAIKATVVDAKTGNSLTVKQSIIRYLGYFVSTIPLGLGIFWGGFLSQIAPLNYMFI
ncbi:RDD family protein [Photobacterium alginatilyticum]|uniref:RDD family protein n=1 Tax=Photobacterium alginatilyticum TaxID=1775171 RepID=UPI0040677A52